MKIMQIISGGDINGAIIHCHLLTRQLLARQHEVVLVCTEPAWIGKQFDGDPRVEVVHSDLSRWPPGELLRVARIARQLGVDVLHTHMSRAHTFGVLLKQMSGVPSVATAHNRYIQLHWMLNNHVIGVSEATTRFHRRYNLVRRRRSQTIHNFIDFQRFTHPGPDARQRVRGEMGVDPSQVLLGTVGDIIPRKGLVYLVRALPEIKRRAPQVRLAVVGAPKQSEDYLQAIRREAAELGVESMIEWTGQRSDIPDVLSALDLYVLPSQEETFGLSIVEAMALSLPVVATSVGGIPEVVLADRTGLLVPPRDPAALAAAIAALVDDPGMRRKMGDSGQRRAAEHFSPEAQTDRVEAVYRQVVAGCGLRDAG